MGSKSSTPVKDNEGGEITTSNGFHMFELHLPTAGKSFLMIIIVMAIAYLLYKWRKRCTRTAHTPHFSNQSFPMMPNQQWFPQMPMLPMLQPPMPLPQRFPSATIEEVADSPKPETKSNGQGQVKRPAFRYEEQDP